VRKVIEKEAKSSSEISFEANLKLNEEKKFIVWNHLKKKKKLFTIKRESPSQYVLYSENIDINNPIFDFYGIWSKFSDEEWDVITEAIKELRSKINQNLI